MCIQCCGFSLSNSKRKKNGKTQVYERLGSTKLSRMIAYKKLFKGDINQRVLSEIRTAATFSMPLGNSKFQDQTEETIGRKLGYSKLGRPTVTKNKCE